MVKKEKLAKEIAEMSDEDFDKGIENLNSLLKEKSVERGEASIFLSLSDSTITVTHGTDNVILYKVENAEDGSWDKIWEAIHAIKSVE